ncbi:MAG: radical SAM protein, partial [Pseudomonadota bacterium]
GQNVNAYRGAAPTGGDWGLGRLILELAQLDGLDRIRYTTSHPRDMDDELITAHRDVPQLMPFLHLPVQSGSDAVLTAMNRRHTAADYLQLVDRLRSARDDLTLSSDFIVGFPTEQDQDFEATLSLVRAVGFAQSFSFKYSPRAGTPGSVMQKQVSDRVKSERLAILQELLTEQTTAFQRSNIGRRLPVLLAKPGRHPGQLVGQTPYLQAVHLQTNAHRIGDLVDVDIVDAGTHSLAGIVSMTPELAAHTNPPEIQR